MAATHVTGMITAPPMDASCLSDKELHKILTDKYDINVGVKGTDVSTGIGFLSYLDKEEVDKCFGQ